MFKIYLQISFDASPFGSLFSKLFIIPLYLFHLTFELLCLLPVSIFDLFDVQPPVCIRGQYHCPVCHYFTAISLQPKRDWVLDSPNDFVIKSQMTQPRALALWKYLSFFALAAFLLWLFFLGVCALNIDLLVFILFHLLGGLNWGGYRLLELWLVNLKNLHCNIVSSLLDHRVIDLLFATQTPLDCAFYNSTCAF